LQSRRKPRNSPLADIVAASNAALRLASFEALAGLLLLGQGLAGSGGTLSLLNRTIPKLTATRFTDHLLSPAKRQDGLLERLDIGEPQRRGRAIEPAVLPGERRDALPVAVRLPGVFATSSPRSVRPRSRPSPKLAEPIRQINSVPTDPAPRVPSLPVVVAGRPVESPWRRFPNESACFRNRRLDARTMHSDER